MGQITRWRRISNYCIESGDGAARIAKIIIGNRVLYEVWRRTRGGWDRVGDTDTPEAARKMV